MNLVSKDSYDRYVQKIHDAQETLEALGVPATQSQVETRLDYTAQAIDACRALHKVLLGERDH